MKLTNMAKDTYESFGTTERYETGREKKEGKFENHSRILDEVKINEKKKLKAKIKQEFSFISGET